VRHDRTVSIVLASIVAAFGLASATTGCAPSIVAGNALRPDAYAEIRMETERARGLRFERPVHARIVTQKELHATVERAATAEWKPHEFERYEQSLVAMGLWPPDRSLLDEFVATIGSAGAGLYVPQESTLYVVSDPETPLSVKLAAAVSRRDIMREMALTHELVHALQHQHYPALIDLLSTTKDQDDAVLALQAAIEGDAVRYGFEAMMTRAAPPSPADFAKRLDAESNDGAIGEAPALIRYSTVFPYVNGYRLSMLESTLLVERPPISTEQALHDDKRHESFLSFDFSALAAALPAGCEPVYENTVGELGMSILFRDLAERPSAAAWRGWDGDRYLVATCAGRPEVVWVTAWDSDDDAREFAQAYGEIAQAIARRAGYSAPAVPETGGRKTIVVTRGLAALAGRLDGLEHETRIADFEDLEKIVAGEH